MEVAKFLNETYRLERDVTKDYIDQLAGTIRKLSRFHGKPWVCGDFSDDAINRWLVWLGESGLSKRSLRGHCGNALVLWRSCFDHGLTTQWPRRIRRIKVPRTLPEAWSQVQVQSLLVEAAKLKGRFRRSGVLKSAFWRAMILYMWDTALRLGDALRLERAQIGSDGSLITVQHKTGEPVLHRLSAETMAAIEMLFPPEREFVFKGALCKRLIFEQFKQLRLAAGLARGGTKYLRRSSATAVEGIEPGAASKHLGHSTPEMARKHYIDVRLLSQERPRPPRIA